MRRFRLCKCRLLSVVLSLFLFFTLLPISSEASYISAEAAADTLSQLGLFKGGDTGYELDRQLTKQEAVTMLVRLLGKEQDALSYIDTGCPFSDVSGWARGYISVAYNDALVNGTSKNRLGATENTDANTYLTFILRALGYSESAGDFTYNNATAFADKIGLTNREYIGAGDDFMREDAVVLSYNALITTMKGTDIKLIEHLIKSDALDRSKLLDTGLSGYYNYGKTIYSSSDIYERTSSASFLLELFSDEKSFKSDEPSGTSSGFFISADGLAITCYHSIELKPYARITTTDGRIYEDIQVIHYDGYRDIAVLKIGKTATDGKSVRFFPYLNLGNSDAISNGNRIYTLSSPGGFPDCISDGMISTKSRIVDDPAYPLIQFTAPISPGSSGGVLLNEYCEAIGVCVGTFTSGNNLNLAVPINSISDLELANSGKSLLEVSQHDKELNANSTLSVSHSTLNIGIDEKTEVIVTRDSPGTVGIQYIIEDPSIIGCKWGSFTTKTTVPIYITGLKKGTTTVTVIYYEGTGNPDASAKIRVTVS